MRSKPTHPGRVPLVGSLDWRDWTPAALAIIVAVAEVLVRNDLASRPLALAGGLLLASALLFRRRRPLLALAAGLTVVTLVDAVSLAIVDQPGSPYANGFVLVLVYALMRFASLRHSLVGLVIAALGGAAGGLVDADDVDEVIGGALVLLLAAALGLTMRYRAIIISQQRDQIRSREREGLSRELHDTVAHHISAIVISSQAGRFLAVAGDVTATVDAFGVIEQEATKTLAEMRAMVGALRGSVSPQTLAPSPGLVDINEMAQDTAGGHRVVVETLGRLDDLHPSLEMTLHRVARESITNARRHGRSGCGIAVLIDGRENDVRIVVSNDGEKVFPTASSPGFGLAGMEERVALLGGTLRVGPLATGGWQVAATIPRAAGHR